MDKKETLKSSNRAYIILFIIGLILFIPSAIISHTHQLKGLEARIFYDINNLPNTYKTVVLWTSSALGSYYPIVLCVGVPLIFKYYRLAWRFFVTVGGAGAVAEIIKRIVREPRPVVLLNGHLHERAIEKGLTSFPSAHQTVATAMALTLWLILPNKWRWISVLWIIIVGFSRIYLGVHTPLDIVGGFGVGAMAVSFVKLLPDKIKTKCKLDDHKPLLQKGW